MLDLIDNLSPGARVLDLGARTGSFATARRDIVIVRLDLEVPAARQSGAYVSGDAALMPFADAVFDVVISNHSLEHFCELERTVCEIGRVIKRSGVLYVAVPDATTLTDRIYRWMGKGGGHVNAFRSPEEVAALIETGTHLPLCSTTLLYSSLSFLNAHNFTSRPPRKIALFGFGNEYFLAAFLHLLRCADRVLGTRLSVYGWSFYFGGTERPAQGEPWPNVCVRCGAGSPVEYLRAADAVRGRRYRCPACGGFNLLAPGGR
jgi:SAM-dependent methyltransferase/DNA-directed RNA polymerase subunit RPC12/RpoP